LLAALAPQASDAIITLGDYVNRGPDSRGVMELLIALAKRCKLIPILGNHDEMLLAALAGESSAAFDWLNIGGAATLESYGSARAAIADLARIPAAHREFLERCLDFHETETHIFVHAQYDPNRPMDQQLPHDLRWASLKYAAPGPHISGKRVIAGHSSQKSGEILDLGYLVCIDTYCYGGGWLTALDIHAEKVWQANNRGELRPAG
jgi:serine/threonine protein phosphatase 1